VAYDKVEQNKKAPKTQEYANQIMKYEVEALKEEDIGRKLPQS